MKYRGPVSRACRWGALLAGGLFLGWMIDLAGCVALLRTINVSEQAGLAQTSRLAITERVNDSPTLYEPRMIVTDPVVLGRINAALDVDLPLRSQVDCLARYRLSFVSATGDVQELGYYCKDGASFLTGTQAFWAGQQVTPPAEFDVILGDLLGTPSK
jgi:hypothetical protein